MSLILAIEPDRRQASQIAALVRNILHAELVLADSTDGALRELGQRLPDLILTSALLSPGDEAALADRLREFDAASAHVQTLTIPVLAASSGESEANGGVLGRLRRKIHLRSAPDGCDPVVFAHQITEYLERSTADRQAQSAVDSRPAADDNPTSTTSAQSQDDGWTDPLAAVDSQEALEAKGASEAFGPAIATFDASPDPELARPTEPAFGAFLSALKPPLLLDPGKSGDIATLDARSWANDYQPAPEDVRGALNEVQLGTGDVPLAHGEPRVAASASRPSTNDSQLTADDVLRALGLSVVSDPVLTKDVAAACEPVGETGDEEVDLTSVLHELEGDRTESSRPGVDVAAEDEYGPISPPLPLADSSRGVRALDLARPRLDFDLKGPLHSPVLAAEWGESELLESDFWGFREPEVDEQEAELWMQLPQNVHLVWPAPQGIVLKDAPAPEWADWATPLKAEFETRWAAVSTGSELTPASPSAPVAPPASPVRTGNEQGRPAIDEWGLFDPAQCGFEALLVKLDEMTAGRR
jgi:hypothetical protein